MLVWALYSTHDESHKDIQFLGNSFEELYLFWGKLPIVLQQ